MANPTLLEQFCSSGQKDAVSSILQTAGWSPENPNINGYQLNTIFNEIYTYLNYLKNKGLSFWESTKTYKATAGDIDIVRYANKIYFAKQDSNLDGLTPMQPDISPTYWGVLNDIDKPLWQLTGYVLPFATSTVPSGFLECNGAELSRITYADLFSVLGTTYGAGDGSTTFNIPDLRGEFIRGFDNGRGIDNGRTVGSWQRGSQLFLDDGNNIGITYFGNSGDTSVSNQSASETWDKYDNLGVINHGANGAGSNDDNYSDQATYFWHTRPRNIAMMYCIKY